MNWKRSHTKRPTLHFVVGNEERFPLLLGMNNALRIFMVLSETKNALAIKNFSTLLPIYSLKFFGLLDFFLGRLDRLPMIRTLVKLKILANFTVGGLHNGSGKASILLRNLKTC